MDMNATRTETEAKMKTTKCPHCGSTDIGAMSVGPSKGLPACSDCDWVQAPQDAIRRGVYCYDGEDADGDECEQAADPTCGNGRCKKHCTDGCSGCNTGKPVRS